MIDVVSLLETILTPNTVAIVVPLGYIALALMLLRAPDSDRWEDEYDV